MLGVHGVEGTGLMAGWPLMSGPCACVWAMCLCLGSGHQRRGSHRGVAAVAVNEAQRMTGVHRLQHVASGWCVSGTAALT